MTKKTCKGCGQVLQSDNINEKGYVPFEKLLVTGDILCRNCFRLKNYGIVPQELTDVEEYEKIVKENIKKSDLILAIFDIVDISSSMVPSILDLLDEKDNIVILNKLDILEPYYTKPSISAWFRELIIENNIFPQSFCYVSAKNKDGINGILHKIKVYAGDKKNISVCVVGASNVGKSSILNRLIGKDKLTTSKYSGTTKREIKTTVKYKDMKISFIDTPGIVPKGRMNELIPCDKSVLLLSNKKIQKKNVKINENQYLMFENLIYLKAINKCSLDLYASKNIQFHITNEAKAKELLNNGFFTLLSIEEATKYLNQEFVTEDIEILQNEALDVHGLGVIEPKCDAKFVITYPKNLKITVRNSIKDAHKRQDEMIW